MTLEEFIALRKHLGLTQAEMAHRMGLSTRSLNAIESGSTPLRTLHIRTAERIAMIRAVVENDPMLVPDEVRAQCTRIHQLATGQRID
ncbi:helix-turn-helix domain-containing protein [Aureimonas mangrovi]|uniref:helix-turn-helix domain-containing protein n=1 Tax=Aureimonas mangrovi TaxID=2758041 RepID=UPI00163D9C74|nr:helix-turn-helix transcriptional regulator [Aureimonas mangrovi]